VFTSRYKDQTQRLNKYLKLLKKIQLEFKYENEAKKQDAYILRKIMYKRLRKQG